MNSLDWLLPLLLAYSVVRALLRGFLREAFALGGLIAAFFLACWNYESVGIRLHQQIHAATFTDPVARFTAILLILLVVMLVATLLGTLLKRTASAVGLGFFDSLLGALFGLGRGVLLGIVFVMAITSFLPIASPEQTWTKNSLLAPYFLRAAHAVSFVMPSELQSHLFDGMQQIQNVPTGWTEHGPSKQTGN